VIHAMKMKFNTMNLDSTGLSLRSSPVGSVILLTIFTSLATAQESAQDIREAKGLVEIPVPPAYGTWIVVSMSALLLGFLLWKFLQRPTTAKSLSAVETALAELEAARSLATQDSSEPLADAVAGTVRRYIEARFGIAAPRLTTEEFMESLRHRPDPRINAFNEDLRLFLRLCDRVKFGRGVIDERGRAALVDGARRFVKSTSSSSEPKPQPVSPALVPA